MKIIDYRLETYLEEMDRPLGDSNGPEGDDLISSSILFIDTDEGISGVAPLGNNKVENLFNGIYLLKFKFKNGEIKVEKLIVQHR